MRRTAALLLLTTGLLGLGACTDGGGSAADLERDDDEPSPLDDDATTTTTAASGAGNDLVCEHLERIEELDREASRVSESAVAQMNAGAEPAVVIAALHEQAAMLQAGQAEMDSAYAAAAAAADPDIAANITELAESTATIMPTLIAVLGGVETIEDMQGMEAALSTPEFTAAARTAATATLELDRFTEAVCGFSMSD
jgi:hypothetical protein